MGTSLSVFNNFISKNYNLIQTEHYLEAYNGTAYGIKVNAAKSEPRI